MLSLVVMDTMETKVQFVNSVFLTVLLVREHLPLAHLVSHQTDFS